MSKRDMKNHQEMVEELCTIVDCSQKDDEKLCPDQCINGKK